MGFEQPRLLSLTALTDSNHQTLPSAMNNLDGEIPEEIQNLHRLELLSMSFNGGLTGPLQPGLEKLDHLKDLELQYCSLSGSIPDWIGNLRKLTNLGLGNNLLTGQLPDKIFKLTDLELLGLDDNTFEGDLAPFGRLSKLESIRRGAYGRARRQLVKDGRT
jgi:Leucine-rich repeat (LRR) protein